MNILLLILTIFYLSIEITSFMRLIKPKDVYKQDIRKTFEKLKKDWQYSDDAYALTQWITGVIFLSIYGVYIGLASSLVSSPIFSIASIVLIFILITDFLRSLKTKIDFDKYLEGICSDNRILYERIKMFFTLGYGLFILIALFIRG